MYKRVVHEWIAQAIDIIKIQESVEDIFFLYWLSSSAVIAITMIAKTRDIYLYPRIFTSIANSSNSAFEK